MQMNYTDTFEIVELAEQVEREIVDEELLHKIDNRLFRGVEDALTSMSAWQKDGYLYLQMMANPGIEIAPDEYNTDGKFTNEIQMRIAITPQTLHETLERMEP